MPHKNHLRNSYQSLFLILLTLSLMGAPIFAAVIQGTVYDQQTGELIPYATIRVEGTGRSMLTNADGNFRLKLAPGQYLIRFSHIAYYSDSAEVTISDSAVNLDIKLRPAVQLLKGIKVYTRAYDPAQKIILEAIARKDSLLNRMKSYSFESYTKMVIRNAKKPDSTNIMLITETQAISNWKRPHKQKETIIARRQTANLEAAGNLASIGGELFNFNENRLNFGSSPIVSPTATDALKYYNYYLIDTVFIDNRLVFRLEVEPKGESTPLFIGTIDIADSSYDVVGVDLTLNRAAEIPFVKNLRYSQKGAEFEKGIWMPIEIRLAGDIDLSFPGIPKMKLELAAALHNYSFDVDYPNGNFDYVIEVAKEADKPDTAAWEARQSVPLTAEEIKGYKRIDSVVKNISILKKAALMAATMPLVMSFASDFFHFNRVEGAYLGLAVYPELLDSRLKFRLKGGRAITAKYWEQDYGIEYGFFKKQKLQLKLGYHDLITHRPTAISQFDGNPTLSSLLARSDPYEYFKEKGFSAQVTSSILSRRTTMGIKYEEYDQYSVANATEYAFFKTDYKYRVNPAIADGRLRSLTYSFKWETINWMKNKGKEEAITSFPYSSLEINLEGMSLTQKGENRRSQFPPGRYSIRFRHSDQWLGIGTTTLFISTGTADQSLPPQKVFTVDCNDGVLHDGLAFKTMGRTNFAGDRMALGYFEHEFGRRLFLKSGLSLFKKIPLTLSTHGGVFWTELKYENRWIGGDSAVTAQKPYSEIGFGVGGLPLLLKLYFTWQLSDYPTNKFSFVLGMGL